MKLMMKRTLNTRERYYQIELIPNLFGETLLIRTYGSSSKTKPTGVIREFYDSDQEVKQQMIVLIAQKHKRGYCSHDTVKGNYHE
ncbi:MAG: WGR domain-containing protein [Sulfuricurvum sp.]|nr:WGR domain-containing protein [Sulfuricurvum sp.]MDD5387443.1 WGR domain-containing protein [Sulfuricurvum sp.]